MSALSKKLRSIEGGRVAFWCGGCDEPHVISVNQGAWTWNGNAEQPTFSPSILVRGGHYADGWKGPGCWCNFNERHPDLAQTRFTCDRCHSFVTDGKTQFLSDCTHKLAGQTVEISDWPGGAGYEGF